MKIAALIAGLLLGFVFVVLPGALMLGLMHPPPPTPGSAAAQFFGLFYPCGWFLVIQICQIVGGILVAIPKTRNFGLLFLGPVIINILCFHFLAAKADYPMPVVIAILALFLLFVERRKFAALAN